MSDLNAFKEYLDRRFGQEDAVLHTIREQAEKEGFPPIQVPIHVGRLLYLLAKIQAPYLILEIGTLAGYSTICLARALQPQGQLISLEINPQYAAKAREHIQYAQLSHCVEIREGHAVNLLAELARTHAKKFDLIFIDADKENNVLYLEWAIHLARPGALLLIDNLIPKGERAGYPSHEEAQAVYIFNDFLAQHPALEVAVSPTLVSQPERLDSLAIIYVKY